MPKKRDLGLDLVRLFSFIAICFYHLTTFAWYSTNVDRVTYFEPWKYIEGYARILSFSGHTIIFLSSFLIARAESRMRKTWFVIAFAMAGWALFCFIERGENKIFWMWDVYPLIALGLATMLIARHAFGRFSIPLVKILGVIGFVFLWLKFWTYSSLINLPLDLRQALIGDCVEDLADWPILPWIGIVWVPYALGTLAHERLKQDPSRPLFSTWAKFESFMWPACFLLALPHVGAFYKIVLGPGFACFSFRQEPYVFWSQFIFVLFLMRISLLKVVNERLQNFAPARWVSGLMISKHFGFAYVLSYIIEAPFEYADFSKIHHEAELTALSCLLIVPTVEVLLRLFSVVIKIVVKPARLKN